MAVPAWRRNRSKLDAEYEAVKFRVIVTQMIMRNFGLKYELCSTKEKVDDGEMEFIEAYNQFKSWRGYLAYFNSYKSIQRINCLFDDLFIKD